ncbi:MAG: rhodanese-like domain-containing protein [Actinomycetota bacterium]
MSAVAIMVEQARAATQSMGPHEFAVAARREGAVTIDVRESDERVAHGAIPGAVHVPRGLLEFRADPASPTHDPRLGPDRTVLIYCTDGRRSALAAASLRALGHRDVAHLAGGLVAWGVADLPITGRSVPPY